MTVWNHVSAELADGWQVFVRRARIGFFAALAVQALVGLGIVGAAPSWPADPLVAAGAIATTVGSQAVLWALGAGATGVGLRLAGWSAVVPFVLVPAGIAIAGYLASDTIAAAENGFLAELGTRAHQIAWMKPGGHHPVIGPVFFVLGFPILVFHIITSVSAFASALHVLILCWMTIIAGACGGGLASLPVLAIAVVMRLAGRASGRAALDRAPVPA